MPETVFKTSIAEVKTSDTVPVTKTETFTTVKETKAEHKMENNKQVVNEKLFVASKPEAVKTTVSETKTLVSVLTTKKSVAEEIKEKLSAEKMDVGKMKKSEDHDSSATCSADEESGNMNDFVVI